MGDIADYYKQHQLQEENINNETIKPKLHKCKDGKIVDIRGIHKDYPKMEDSHLLNTIKFIENKAKQGVVISYGGGINAEDMWYDEETLSYKKGLKHLGYKHYVNEAIKRKICTITNVN
jgi:hypothetical protein